MEYGFIQIFDMSQKLIKFINYDKTLKLFLKYFKGGR